MTPVFSGKIENGKLRITERDKFDIYLSRFEGKDIDLIVEKKGLARTRTLRENSYYWGVVLKLISDEAGHSADDIHDYCKAKFLSKIVMKEKVSGSTKKLSTIKFEEYLENIRRWASIELSCVIPLPNEVLN